MEFTKRLIHWYRENKRNLPFRNTQDPYHIWVSEIMAQQTQIQTMIPYYEAWIKSFPNIESLAKAQIDDVLKMWEGLGYYNRARNLHKGAQYVMEHYNGILPSSKNELIKIPGIGDYTSSAIASIAFNKPEIAIDGNVKRVMARYLNYQEDANSKKAHDTFKAFLLNELIESNAQPQEFTQALMELGALVYTPSNTKCEGSPFKEMCACYRGENRGTIPYFKPKKKVPIKKVTVYFYIENNHILMSNDDSDNLMKGLMRLPQVDGHSKIKPSFKMTHKFTHLHWQIHVLETKPPIEHSSWFLFPINHLDDIPIITAHKKIIHKLIKVNQ